MDDNTSFIKGRLQRDLKAGKLDQITAKAYLDENVFPMLDKSLNHLLETIERNGEFEKYVEMLADRVEKQSRELRRRAREMKRLELGDDYHSSDTEESKPADEESDDYDSYGDESALQDGVDPSAGGQLSPDLPSAAKINEDANSSLRKGGGGSIARLSETHTIAVD